MLKRILVRTYAMSSCMRPTRHGFAKNTEKKKNFLKPHFISTSLDRERERGRRRNARGELLRTLDNELLSPDTYGGGTMKPAPFLKIFPLSRRPTTNHQ